MAFSLSVVVPAFNEEVGIADTVEALLDQSVPAERIIVIDDCSTDNTGEIAASYEGVEVIRPPQNLGSKAAAQNYALDHVDTDLILPVDADTLLAKDYIEHIKKPFAEDKVMIAAGCVQTRYAKRPTERGRQIEYLFGFHWHRPIQAKANAPVVCSGCCSAFRTDALKGFGGFPDRTIVEDMDYTWSQQIAGNKAVYVGEAVAWAADPETFHFLRKQVWRWMAGFMQNVRIHSKQLRRKPMLALWIALAMIEILTAPLWWGAPFFLVGVMDQPVETVALWWLGFECLLTLPPLIYACIRRKLNPLKVFANIPFVYSNKVINTYYAWKAIMVELAMVPLGLSEGLHDYQKGH